MWKACSRCGKIHNSNYDCNKGKVYKQDEERKLRNKFAWAKKSKQIRADANNLCEVCKAEGRYTYNNVEVHHIIKLKDDPTKLLEDDNLICLCIEHHKQADNGTLPKEYLQSLARNRLNTIEAGKRYNPPPV